jgi:predicted CoA-binding protein
MNNPKVLILGASDNPERYSYRAMSLFQHHGYPVALVGNKNKEVQGLPIHQAFPPEFSPEVITLYVGPANQRHWYDAILNSGARKVIFNPGTESKELQALLDQHQIAWEEACTLVLLNTNQFS